MTTIAYDGKILAADTRYTSNGFVSGHASKIVKLDDASYLAVAGCIEFVPILAKWLSGGEKPEIEKDNDFEAIHIKNGIATTYSGNLNGYPSLIPYASGSGEPFALAAMKCGKNAYEAVQIACQIDIYSGGDIELVVIRL